MNINIMQTINTIFDNYQINVSDNYRNVLQKITDIGLISNTQIMFDLNSLLFHNKKVLAKKLLKHSIYETIGGDLINNFSSQFAYDGLKQDLLRQAKDELKHGRMLEHLIQFTDESVEQFRLEIQKLMESDELPDFHGDIKLFLCFVHVAEIRTLIMLEQYVVIIEKMQDSRLLEMLPFFLRIKKDEIQHAAYTGAYINQWLENDSKIADQLLNCFLFTNKESMQEIASIAYDLSCNL
ncbi:MAG: ferritin-like domain-containing protein [Gammaproteobacteria bacterium]